MSRHKATGINYTLTDATGKVVENRNQMTLLFYLLGQGLLLPDVATALRRVNGHDDDTLQARVLLQTQ